QRFHVGPSHRAPGLRTPGLIGDIDASTPGTSTPGRRGERRRRPADPLLARRGDPSQEEGAPAGVGKSDSERSRLPEIPCPGVLPSLIPLKMKAWTCDDNLVVV